MRSFVALAALARVAAAQPSATPPEAPAPDWKPVSWSASVGIVSQSTNPFGMDQDADGSPRGIGPWIELEVSKRGRRFGIAAVASYMVYHDGLAFLGYSCGITGLDSGDITVQMASVGARVRVYAGHWSFGIGALASLVIARGTHTVVGGAPCTSDGTYPLRDAQIDTTLDLLVSYTFRRLGRIQPEVTLATSGTGSAYVLLGGRVSIGVRF